MHKNKISTSPWRWMPTTFFMEGFPGVMIMVVTSIMYKNLGLSNERITLYTGLLTLPWVIKPLWASLVDIYKCKAWWIYVTQLLMGASFVALAFSLQSGEDYFFPASLACCWAVAFCSASHDIAADGYYLVELDPSKQAFFLGFQSAAYQIGKILAQGILVMFAGYLFTRLNNYFDVWSIVLAIAGGVCLLVGLYHKIILPRDHTLVAKPNLRETWNNFVLVYQEFFKLEGVWFAVLFLLLFRFGEQLLSPMIPLFLLDKVSAGGLDLGNQFTGFAYGSCSPLAILFGGLLGGYVIYRNGFKRWIWPMVFIINIPHTLYVVLAYLQIRDPMLVLPVILIEQFCFSFGFAAYMMFLMYAVRNSKFKTAHYSFFSGLMLLGLMIPKMLSGWLQSVMGYTNFFILILFMIIPAIILIPFLKMDASYGKRSTVKA